VESRSVITSNWKSSENWTEKISLSDKIYHSENNISKNIKIFYIKEKDK
jgi:hypothetical protein